MKKLWILTLIALALISCKPEEETPYLSVESTQVTLSSFQGVEMVSVSTNREYTATSSQPWCTATPAGNLLKVAVN